MIDQIQAELDRLQVSTNADPASGLTIEPTDEAGQVSVFDDHERGNYAPHQLLSILRSLQPADVSLSGDNPNNIWQHIKRAEF